MLRRLSLRRQASRVFARSLIVSSIFPLKRIAASGRDPFSSTPLGPTLSVPETRNPIALKLKVPSFPYQFSARSSMLFENSVLTWLSSAWIRFSASACGSLCGTAISSFGILLLLFYTIPSCPGSLLHYFLTRKLLFYNRIFRAKSFLLIFNFLSYYSDSLSSEDVCRFVDLSGNNYLLSDS